MGNEKSEMRNKKWNEMEITQIRNEKMKWNGNHKLEIRNEKLNRNEIRN